MHSHVDVYNFTEKKWVDRFDTPKEMANSHLGVVTDGRYIYVVSGQKGPQCRPSVPLVFSVDTRTRKWLSLPSLPEPRYIRICKICLLFLFFDTHMFAELT